jgi:hypothetical protein
MCILVERYRSKATIHFLPEIFEEVRLKIYGQNQRAGIRSGICRKVKANNVFPAISGVRPVSVHALFRVGYFIAN